MGRAAKRKLRLVFPAVENEADPRQIAKALKVLFEPGTLVELRAPGTAKATVSGYFTKIPQLAQAAAKWSGEAPGVYVTLNPVNPALVARSNNRVTEYAKHTTGDADIIKRQWLPIDLDAIRPAGISATDEEHICALERAEKVRDHLLALGWPDPVLADSGNGAHLLYRIDLPNDDASRLLIQRCLESLDVLFTDDRVRVDQTTSNAARIWKLYGTVAAKGDSLPERPHRRAKLLDVPKTLKVLERSTLQQLANSIPAASKDEDSANFNLSLWIKNHDLHVIYDGLWKQGHKWILNPCPWNPAHTNSSAFIVQLESGAIAAGCHHNSCHGKNWHALRDLLEPGWREKITTRPIGVVTGTEQTGDDEEEHFTDVRNAERLIAQHGKDLRFCSAWGSWLIWTGTRWVKDETDEVERRAKRTSRLLYQEAADEPVKKLREALVENALRLESQSRLASMIKLAKSEAGVSCTPKQLDADPWTLNLPNGTLDLHTGELRAHRREDLILKQAPVKYDSTALCPTWDNFLKQVMNLDGELTRFLQKAVGYSLTGDTSEQVIFILYGTGANGKSTFINTVMSLLGVGEYAMQTPTETLLTKRGSSIPNDVARLHGARFVAAVEAEHGRSLAEALVKQLTGGDMISARFLHREWFDFKPAFKVFLAVNHKPKIRGTDHAIWRRIRLIPFKVTIPDDRQDKRLTEKLRGELPGILRWAVEGCLLWQRDGLGVPPAVEDATAAYRKEMDVIATFLAECCRCRPEGYVTVKDMYDAYTNWCRDTGEYPVPQRVFNTALTERGVKKKRTATSRGWRGIELVTDDDK
jgi:P4 family phage/plasmid primase-like protien